MTRLAILGASGHGKVVADAATLGGWDDVVFYDDHISNRTGMERWSTAGTTADLVRECGKYDGVIVAIGANRVRVARHHELVAAGATMTSIVHPSAIVSAHARVGLGSVVCASAVIAPCAVLGLACIINHGATIDHDCAVGDGVHVSPGGHLGGTVRIGHLSWLGIGAVVRNNIIIGANVVVGAGAAVVGDVGDDLTIVGVPARPV